MEHVEDAGDTVEVAFDVVRARHRATDPEISAARRLRLGRHHLGQQRGRLHRLAVHRRPAAVAASASDAVADRRVTVELRRRLDAGRGVYAPDGTGLGAPAGTDARLAGTRVRARPATASVVAGKSRQGSFRHYHRQRPEQPIIFSVVVVYYILLYYYTSANLHEWHMAPTDRCRGDVATYRR